MYVIPSAVSSSLYLTTLGSILATSSAIKPGSAVALPSNLSYVTPTNLLIEFRAPSIGLTFSLYVILDVSVILENRPELAFDDPTVVPSIAPPLISTLLLNKLPLNLVALIVPLLGVKLNLLLLVVTAVIIPLVDVIKVV